MPSLLLREEFEKSQDNMTKKKKYSFPVYGMILGLSLGVRGFPLK